VGARASPGRRPCDVSAPAPPRSAPRDALEAPTRPIVGLRAVERPEAALTGDDHEQLS
jgi:hypothetical protein